MTGSGSHATSSGEAYLDVVQWKDRHLGKFCTVHGSIISGCHLVCSHVLVEIAAL
jgi:hypothetical protein